jgi:hypothetical protein
VHDARDHLERVIGRPRELVVGDDGHLAGDHGAAPRPSIDDIPGVIVVTSTAPFSLTESLKLSSRSGALGELGLEGLFAGPIPPMWG